MGRNSHPKSLFAFNVDHSSLMDRDFDRAETETLEAFHDHGKTLRVIAEGL